ncbi:hypothetical protein AAVH_11021 [Aphelenchoides avenae]|nr:hypothetical protein AAVH_11021 [Aphelenchus avenae]
MQIESDIARSVIAEESEDHHSTDTTENDEVSEAASLADNREHDEDPDDDSEEALVPWTEPSPQLFAIIPKKKYAKLIEENHQKIAAANVHERVAVTLESLRSYKLYARNINGHWHRIRVINLPASARSREFSLDDSALRRLTGGLVDITELGLSDETFAYKCRLLYVRPKDNEAGWPKTAAAAFQRRLAAAEHISVPELSQRDWVTPAEASQPDMVRGLVDIFADGESVSQALVAEGHADWNYST